MLDLVLYARERSRSPTFQPQLYILDNSIRTVIICMFQDAPDHITKLTVCNPAFILCAMVGVSKALKTTGTWIGTTDRIATLDAFNLRPVRHEHCQ